MDKIWRVNDNGFASERSIDPSHLETFKKDPLSSFAREIVQNSIDAKREDREKVIVEFKPFVLNQSDLPDRHTLINGFYNVLENWKSKTKTKENDLRRMREMYDLVKQEKIESIRVSDFNTTGLVGVNQNDEESPFYALTKGDGVSFKGGTSGGSKGIGKYASFVVSELHTIFYSTVTITNEYGYMGKALLPSGIYINPKTLEKTEGLKTTGDWFYSKTERNLAIKDNLVLDRTFKRLDDQTGTDLYILGFKKEDNWKETMIVKILESFSVAIIRDQLEVRIDEIILNSKTIGTIIENLTIRKSSVDYKVIKSQYDLLTSEETYKVPITIPNYGTVDLFVLSHSKEESDIASRRCVMVRYPYMKIRDYTRINQMPFSAMAIIEDNKINEILRKFENPEHTDWFFKRNDHLKQEGEEARKIHNLMREQIINNINDYLFDSDKIETDVEGASDYLPQEEIGDGVSKTKVITEKIKIHKSRVRKNIDEVGHFESETEESLNPDLGDISKDGEEIATSDDLNSKELNENENFNINEGDNVDYLTKTRLEGVRYRLILLDPSLGKYLLRFSHNENIEKCDLKIDIIGDSATSNENHNLNILKATLREDKLQTNKNNIYNFSINKDEVNDIYIYTDQKEIFSGRVTVYAYR